MSGQLQNVVVIGGSGNLGPAVIQELLNAGLTVTATTRPTSSSTFPSAVKVIKTDFSKDSLVSIFRGQDVVLSLAAGAVISDQKVYADAAAEAGVKRFFPSEFGADTTNEVLGEVLPFVKQKREVVKHLETLQSSGLTWTALSTGPFLDWGVKVGFLGFDLANKKAKVYDNGSKQFSTTSLATIGKSIANILTNPQLVTATANQYVGVGPSTISQNDILAVLEEATGTKWEIEDIDAAALEKASEAEVAKGNYGAYFGILQARLFGKHGGSADLDQTSYGLWNDKLGITEDYKTVIKSLI